MIDAKSGGDLPPVPYIHGSVTVASMPGGNLSAMYLNGGHAVSFCSAAECPGEERRRSACPRPRGNLSDPVHTLSATPIPLNQNAPPPNAPKNPWAPGGQ